MKVTSINSAGLDLIKKFESFQSKPYKCPAGVPTIGYGTIRYRNGLKVSLNDMPISIEQATRLLMDDVYNFELAVDAMATDALTSNQFSALVSFAYNLGQQALKGSTLLKKVNANPNDPTIKDAFLAWAFADASHDKKDNDGDGLIDEPGEMGKLQGLINRRTAEADLYFTK